MPIDEDLPSLEALAEKATKTNSEKRFLKVSVTLQLHEQDAADGTAGQF